MGYADMTMKWARDARTDCRERASPAPGLIGFIDAA